MNPYLELKKLLGSRQRAVTGEVAEIAGRSIKVRTASGIIDARAVDATLYVVGDEVLLRGTIVQGKVKSQASVPTYKV